MASLLARSSVKFGVAKPASRRTSVVVKGTATRDPKLTSWFPGNTGLPGYLDGSLPGDFGFDPLYLGQDPAKLKWYVQGELVNGRFAMLAVVGILTPELLASVGGGGPAAAIPWYEAGAYEYFAPAKPLFAVMMALFFWVEMRRYMDFVNPGSCNQDPIFPNNKLPAGNTPGYPGGIFDPLGFSKGDLKTLKVKEIKNGRLAMLAFAGIVAQHYTTGTTPLRNLGAHLADPWTTTVWQNDLARL
ncbi:hypothetical protein HYH03_007790 [Edaphochlamys debaryana]|uniref:Chlorophyll a-b binding protein, chloroplastic n=1 Tax=Edaphochlamys debaryana TaxID=47281 RepID=A0A836BZ06_9CHLO|nr:hypothetical protein HYH03_007790 [Edaphochlamys debaryana]|eukprot:KAG2494155.1 hypothetical protein HYH03_007790 [Edaphochlamys debaryana]